MIELVKGLEYINLYRERCFVLELNFNKKTFCVGFKEVDEETLKNYGFRFNIKCVSDRFLWNFIAMKNGFTEIEKDYKTTNILDLKNTFSRHLLKELKKELAAGVKQ